MNDEERRQEVIFDTTGKGVAVHILFERDYEEKTESTMYEVACTKKELITKKPLNKRYDFKHITCKNCMRHAYYKKVTAELEERVERDKLNAKNLAKQRGEISNEKHEKKKSKNMNEDEVLVFCAMNQHGEPLVTVMAPDIDLAKQKIVDELEKDKKKMRGWNKGGKVVKSKRIPKHQMDDFYYGLIKEFREINVAMLNGITTIVKQLSAILEMAGVEFKSRGELRKVLAILERYGIYSHQNSGKTGKQKKSGRKIISRKKKIEGEKK